MKIDRKKVYDIYMAWVRRISEKYDWKSEFTPKEIVDKICSIIESGKATKNEDIKLLSEKELKNLVKNPKYRVYHKPTKLWVYFRELKDKFGVVAQSTICLALKNDATVSNSKQDLETLIKLGGFNGDPLYGQNNFLEFQIKKI